MTEGHVQFNGKHYQFYLSKQPGMACQTPDCSTCKEASAKHDAGLEAQANAVRQAAEQEEADKAARVAQADKDSQAQAIRLKAASMRSQAVNAITTTKANLIEEAEAEYRRIIDRAQAECDTTKANALAALNHVVDDLIVKEHEGMAAVNAVDWQARAME